MPFAFDLLDEEQQKKAAAQDPNQSAAPAMTGGGSSFGAGAPQAQQPGQEKGTAQQGSGFVNLDKYMQANQGNQFGGQFTGKVQGDVNTAKDTLNQSAGDFTKASNQGAVKWNDVKDPLTSIVSNAGDNTSADDVSKVKGWSNAQYQGPESFTGSAYGTKAQGAAQKASQETGALQSEGGRFALLDQFYGRPKYSMGQKTLDNALVQNTPGVAARSQNLGTQGKQIQADVGQQSQDLNNLVTSNKGATQDAAKNAKEFVSGALGDFGTGLDKRYQDYNAANDAYNSGLRSDISDDALTDQTMAAYGLNPDENLYNVNLAGYLGDSPRASLGQFASDQDYAKYKALSQLAGQDPTELSDANRAQAGSGATMGRYSVDSGKLKSDISSAKNAYESQAAPMQAQIGSADSELQRVQGLLSAYGPSRGGKDLEHGGQMPDPAYDGLVALVQDRAAKLQAAKSAFDSLQSGYQVNRKTTRQV